MGPQTQSNRAVTSLRKVMSGTTWLSAQDDPTEGGVTLVVGTRQVSETLRPRQEGSSEPRDMSAQNTHSPLPGTLGPQAPRISFPNGPSLLPQPSLGMGSQRPKCELNGDTCTQVSLCAFLKDLTLTVEPGLGGKETGGRAALPAPPHSGAQPPLQEF